MGKKFEQLLAAAVARADSGGEGMFWQAVDGETFLATIGAGTLRIGRGSTQVAGDDGEYHPATTYTMWVTDLQGRVVEELDVIEGHSVTYQLAEQLFRAGRRAAYGGDHVLTNMLMVLQAGG